MLLDEHVSLCVCACMCVCMRVYVFPVTYLENHISKLCEILYAYLLWSWLSPPLTSSQYVMYFQFCE